MELKESLKKLPRQPGIYLMKNSAGIVIYVGKARNLKARVSQYFQKRNHPVKIIEMINQIDSFEYLTTDTELEAFLLECRTIRQLKPRYNKLLKNCEGYKYIRISINENYPGISEVSRKKEDDALYFGPFTSKSSVVHTIEFFKDYYHIRKCGSGIPDKKSACLNYYLGNCLGPCRGDDVQKEYREQIDSIVRLLQGINREPIKELNARMKSAAENLEFEKAVKYREQIKGVRHVINKQRVIKVSKYGRNILAVEKYSQEELKIFLIKGNKLLHAEKVNFQDCDDSVPEEKLKNLVNAYIKPAQKDREAGMNQEDIDEAQIIYSYLKKNKNGIMSFNIPASRINDYNYGRILDCMGKLR